VAGLNYQLGALVKERLHEVQTMNWALVGELNRYISAVAYIVQQSQLMGLSSPVYHGVKVLSAMPALYKYRDIERSNPGWPSCLRVQYEGCLNLDVSHGPNFIVRSALSARSFIPSDIAKTAEFTDLRRWVLMKVKRQSLSGAAVPGPLPQ
jgi:hypothetical protein